MEDMMKKLFAALLACLMLGMLFTACTSDEKEKETAEAVVGDLKEEDTKEYFVPEVDHEDDTKNYELGGVPLA